MYKCRQYARGYSDCILSIKNDIIDQTHVYNFGFLAVLHTKMAQIRTPIEKLLWTNGLYIVDKWITYATNTENYSKKCEFMQNFINIH